MGSEVQGLKELRVFTPIGMMEHWNNGLWGNEGMGYWENQFDKL
jgi:hypothetical protein